MIETFAIPLAFIIMATLTLWIVIGSKGWWCLKALAVVLTSAFSICLWWSLDDLQGWPTNEPIPQKFEIKWITVEEPNKKMDSEGAIYVWLKDLDPCHANHSWYMSVKHSKIAEEPRIHKLPYSRAGHQQAMQVQDQIAKGGKFYGERNGDGTPGNGKRKGEGKGKSPYGEEGKVEGGGDGLGSLSQQQDFIFHELPPPCFPQKILE